MGKSAAGPALLGIAVVAGSISWAGTAPVSAQSPTMPGSAATMCTHGCVVQFGAFGWTDDVFRWMQPGASRRVGTVGTNGSTPWLAGESTRYSAQAFAVLIEMMGYDPTRQPPSWNDGTPPGDNPDVPPNQLDLTRQLTPPGGDEEWTPPWQPPGPDDRLIADDPYDGITSTPEPITMLLMGTGLAGVGLARRRRRKVEEADPV